MFALEPVPAIATDLGEKLSASPDINDIVKLTFLAQQIAQHATAGERALQVQFIDPAHQRQACLVDRPWQVIHRV